jgi:hypothetical protein
VLLLPFEDVGEVGQVVGHQGIEDVVILQKLHAVLHEIVDELAQSYLVRGPVFQAKQILLDLSD